MFKIILNFFDKFEDRVRGNLSRFPLIYTLIGGISIVLFWRGVWHTADMLQARGGILGFIFYEPVNMVLVIIVLLATGLFVSYFIGDTILISGLRQQKKTTEKTKKDIEDEEAELKEMRASIKEIKKEMDEIKEVMVQEDIMEKK
jgi:mannitol-specific phosphotransferase system IIBC component